MRRIFMDLEMNPVSREYKAERKVWTQEVIEIGAVCLNEKNEETDSFQCYVRPKYNKGVAPNITSITGIRTEQVENADSFEKALMRFIAWCGEDYEVYSWSESDPEQLQKEMELKNVKDSSEISYMFLHWHDLQKEYDDMFFCERQISLRTAVSNAGIDFRGHAHSALADAMATADIYREMGEGRTLNKISSMLGSAKKPLGTNLGALLGGILLQTA